MITIITMAILYGFDLFFLFWLIYFPNQKDLFTNVLLVLVYHICISILLSKILNYFFPLKVGKFSTNSPEYDRWRAQGIIAISCTLLFDQYLPLWLKPFWFRLFGATLSKNVMISGKILDPILLTMSENSTLGVEAMILGHQIANNQISIGHIFIGKNSVIGARAMILPNVIIGENATLGANSLLTSGKRINDGETWIGSPAKLLNSNQNNKI
jgi:hypothetical protein